MKWWPASSLLATTDEAPRPRNRRNAGIAGPTAPVEEYDAGAFAAVVGVNLQGTFNVTQRAIPLLKESDAASIVTMSSLAGWFGYPNRVAYSTTKRGLIGFSKTLAMELGPFGIAVDGPRIMGFFEGGASVSGRTVEEETDSAMANQSVKKFVNPHDIATLILFLASASQQDAPVSDAGTQQQLH